LANARLKVSESTAEALKSELKELKLKRDNYLKGQTILTKFFSENPGSEEK